MKYRRKKLQRFSQENHENQKYEKYGLRECPDYIIVWSWESVYIASKDAGPHVNSPYKGESHMF